MAARDAMAHCRRRGELLLQEEKIVQDVTIRIFCSQCSNNSDEIQCGQWEIQRLTADCRRRGRGELLLLQEKAAGGPRIRSSSV